MPASCSISERSCSTLPLKVGTRSKAERGYALAFDVAQPAAKAELFGITAEHVVDDVIALLAGSSWHHLLKNQLGASRRLWGQKRACARLLPEGSGRYDFGGMYPVKKHGPWVVAHLRVVTPSGDPV
jgi:hypothetical protein